VVLRTTTSLTSCRGEVTKMFVLMACRSNVTSRSLNTSSMAVRAGSVYLYSYDVDRVQVSAVDRVVLQTSFGSGVAGDAVLVRLARSLTVTRSVRSVCLHSGAAEYAQPGSGGYGPCVVAGWAPSRAASTCTSLCLT